MTTPPEPTVLTNDAVLAILRQAASPDRQTDRIVITGTDER